ncbi:MAG TPA: class I SAM-dependent methyltransferase [Verrucomicrobiae bacterium]|jgi:SAM-dependent methyltransferase|nr:class I SAM-dependent methyltransferase [Verrucomicrobiae bacterium]
MGYKTALKRLLPQGLIETTRPLRLYFEPQHRFDRRHGVDTTGFIEPEDLGAPEANAQETGGYEPTPRAAFRRIIKNLGLDYERYTFVDMGSGKGAVLLYAADFPFQEIIGVEFSPALNRIAERNLAAYRGKKRCARVKTLCMNAAAFPIPEGPAVLFLFNPFKGRTLETVSGNIERAVEAVAGDLVVVYYHTESRHPVFDEAKRLQTVHRGADHTVYRAINPDY